MWPLAGSNFFGRHGSADESQDVEITDQCSISLRSDAARCQELPNGRASGDDFQPISIRQGQPQIGGLNGPLAYYAEWVWHGAVGPRGANHYMPSAAVFAFDLILDHLRFRRVLVHVGGRKVPPPLQTGISHDAIECLANRGHGG
jgi:hypothetical protein